MSVDMEEFRSWVLCRTRQGVTYFGKLSSEDDANYGIHLLEAYTYERIQVPVQLPVEEQSHIVKSERKIAFNVRIVPQELLRPLVEWWVEPDSQSVFLHDEDIQRIERMSVKSTTVLSHFGGLVLFARQKELEARAGNSNIQVIRR